MKLLNTQVEASVLVLTAQIVTAHVGHNSVTSDEIAKLIRDVHAALLEIEGIKTPSIMEPAEAPRSTLPKSQPAPRLPGTQPAVPPEKSIFPDYIICLEDGRRLKTLRRHLKAAFKMTPEQYREKWNLDANYPMVAANYSEVRSNLAKESRFGRGPVHPPAAASGRRSGAVEAMTPARSRKPAPAPVSKKSPQRRK